MNPKRKELLSSFFKGDKWRLNRCLAPGMNCTATAIQAHSLPNSQVFDLLVRDGHVKAVRKRIDKDLGPVISFDDVGRNQATTFAGFCSTHDNEIFRPIDAAAFRPADAQYQFLLAYRAVARELHAVMEGAIKIQSGYLKRVGLGLDPKEKPSPAGLLAVEHMIKAYATFMYKERLDKILVSKQYEIVLHDTISIRHDDPTVAVCALFALDDVEREDDCVRTTLNVLPLIRNESMAVFSYMPEDAELARLSLSRLLNSEGSCQKYLLSKLILNKCENFVVSPRYYDKWTLRKKKSVIEFFTRTLSTEALDVEDESLYLF